MKKIFPITIFILFLLFYYQLFVLASNSPKPESNLNINSFNIGFGLLNNTSMNKNRNNLINDIQNKNYTIKEDIFYEDDYHPHLNFSFDQKTYTNNLFWSYSILFSITDYGFHCTKNEWNGETIAVRLSTLYLSGMFSFYYTLFSVNKFYILSGIGPNFHYYLCLPEVEYTENVDNYPDDINPSFYSGFSIGIHLKLEFLYFITNNSGININGILLYSRLIENQIYGYIINLGYIYKY